MGVESVGGTSRAILSAVSGTAEDAALASDLTGVVVAGAASLSASQPASDALSNAPAVNTNAVITYAAVPGQRHRLTGLGFSYNAAPTGGRLTVVDGATTRVDIDLTSAGYTDLTLPPGGIFGAVNTALVITLAAAGAAVTGKVWASKLTA